MKQEYLQLRIEADLLAKARMYAANLNLPLSHIVREAIKKLIIENPADETVSEPSVRQMPQGLPPLSKSMQERVDQIKREIAEKREATRWERQKARAIANGQFWDMDNNKPYEGYEHHFEKF